MVKVLAILKVQQTSLTSRNAWYEDHQDIYGSNGVLGKLMTASTTVYMVISYRGSRGFN
jgi:hypothetical protein